MKLSNIFFGVLYGFGTLFLLVALTACGDDYDVVEQIGVPGPQGEQGPQGPAGEKGETGAAGEQGAQGEQGPAGADGEQGPQGEPGQDGQDGKDGDDGILAVIDPCGDNPNKHDEILLVLNNGDILAYFESGNKRFLSLLECGTNYRTTDSQKCHFSLDENCEYSED